MSKPLPRRSALKTIGAGGAILGLPETVGAQEKATTASDTPSTNNAMHFGRFVLPQSQPDIHVGGAPMKSA